MSQFSIDNLLRIADEREKRLQDFRANWRKGRKHKDDERREYVQHCEDESTIIFMLRKMAEFLSDRRI